MISETIIGIVLGFAGSLLVLRGPSKSKPYNAPVLPRVPQLAEPYESLDVLRTRVREHRELAHDNDLHGGNHRAPCRACDLFEQRLNRALLASRGPISVC